MSVRRNLNLGSSQMRTRRHRLFLVRFYIILFFFLVILFSLAILSGHDKAIIKTFLISGNNSVTNTEIFKITDNNIEGRYLGLFAKNNFLIFPRFEIEKDILDQIKTIKSVNISWKDWQIVTISIEERRPHSVWCGDDVKKAEANCYFMDQTGYIFAEAPVFSGNIFIRNYSLPVIQGASSTDPIGTYFLSTSIYSKIFSLIDLLDGRGIAVSKVYFDQMDFTFYLTTGQTIIFNDKEGGFDSAFQNLFSALDSKDLDLVDDGDKIKYIDLRFESKIVVGKKEI